LALAWRDAALFSRFAGKREIMNNPVVKIQSVECAIENS
jgi:hypothetical protein